MSLIDYGCRSCGMITEEIRAGSQVDTPPLGDDGSILKCDLCGERFWQRVKGSFSPPMIRISKKKRGRPSQSYEHGQRLQSDRTIWPMRSNFTKKVYYKDKRTGRVRAKKVNLTFNSRREYESYMDKNGFTYYEENSDDVRDQRYISPKHKKLHERFGDKVMDKIQSGAKFLTEQEIQNGQALA